MCGQSLLYQTAKYSPFTLSQSILLGSSLLERSFWLICGKWALERPEEEPVGRLLKLARLKLTEAGAVVIGCSGLRYILWKGTSRTCWNIGPTAGQGNRGVSEGFLKTIFKNWIHCVGSLPTSDDFLVCFLSLLTYFECLLGGDHCVHYCVF